jgi:hypothetical protein
LNLVEKSQNSHPNLPSIKNMHALNTIDNNPVSSLLEFENLKRNFGVGLDNNNANVPSLKSLRPEVFKYI